MEPKPYFHLLLCIFLILLLNPFLVSTRSISTHQHQHDHSEILSPPLDFLDNMIGSRKGNTTKDLSQLKKYLSNLGYISSHNIKHEYDDIFDDNLELAIKRYQRFFKLDVNGVIDDNTVNTMKQPRCGLPDLFEETMFDSKYAFFPGQPRWPATKRNLTYSFPAGIRDDVKQAIRVASGLWTGVSPFKFTYIEIFEKADIKISFKYWNHGDGFPFNGPRGVLAHAFWPSDGRLHYDGSENWANGAVPGAFDLQSLGLHELGHILGLAHSSVAGAIMWPTFSEGSRKGLSQDDISGIKQLYPS